MMAGFVTLQKNSNNQIHSCKNLIIPQALIATTNVIGFNQRLFQYRLFHRLKLDANATDPTGRLTTLESQKPTNPRIW